MFKMILFLVMVAIPLGGDFRIIFLIMLGGLEAMYILQHKKLVLRSENKQFYTGVFVWCIWNVVVFFMYMRGLERLIQCVVFSITALVFSMHGFTKSDLSFTKKISVALLASWYLYIPFGWKEIEFYSAYMSNANSLGLMTLNLLVVFMITARPKRLGDKLLIAADLLMLLLCESRSAQVAAVMMFAVYGFTMYFKLGKKKRSLEFIFLATLAVIAALIIVYPSLYGTHLGSALNVWSIKYTGKNFFSGRHIMWRNLMEVIEKKPWLGYGLSAVPADFFKAVHSGHNLYLQTMLQTGVIGLVLLVNLLYQALRSMRKTMNRYSHIVICYLMAKMIHECFEVAITQNNWHVGMCFWVFVGIAMAKRETGCSTSAVQVHGQQLR